MARSKKALTISLDGLSTSVLACRVDESEAVVATAAARLSGAVEARLTVDPLIEDAELDRLDAAVAEAHKAHDRAIARHDAYTTQHAASLATEAETARLTRRETAAVRASELAPSLADRWARLTQEINALLTDIDAHEAEVSGINLERAGGEPVMTDAVSQLLRRDGTPEDVVSSEAYLAWARVGWARPLSPEAARSVRVQEDGTGWLDGDRERPCERRTFRREIVRPRVSTVEGRSPIDQLRCLDLSLRFERPGKAVSPPFIERVVPTQQSDEE